MLVCEADVGSTYLFSSKFIFFGLTNVSNYTSYFVSNRFISDPEEGNNCKIMGSRRHPQPSPEEDRTIDLDLSLATRRSAASRYSNNRNTEQTMAPPPPPPAASDITLHRLGHLDIHADDAAGSPGAAA